MRIEKQLRKDRETLLRFLDVYGGGSAALGASNKYVQPGFFVLGCAFIQEYVEPVFFRKVDLLLNVLENYGFPAGSGAIGGMKSDQIKCKESADLLLKAAKDWQGGDAGARVEVSWASSEFTTALRQMLERLKNLIFPLLEQNMSPEEEQQILEGLNKITLESSAQNEGDKHIKQIEALEDELSDWK
jgi:hemerythrin-like domain-containing protein